jgi:hypothetical protein
MDLPTVDNPFSERVRAVVQKTRELRRGPYYQHLYIVKDDGEPALRLWALSCLIQDRADALPSYQQFIQQLKDKACWYYGRVTYEVLMSWTGQWRRLLGAGVVLMYEAKKCNILSTRVALASSDRCGRPQGRIYTNPAKLTTRWHRYIKNVRPGLLATYAVHAQSCISGGDLSGRRLCVLSSSWTFRAH